MGNVGTVKYYFHKIVSSWAFKNLYIWKGCDESDRKYNTRERHTDFKSVVHNGMKTKVLKNLAMPTRFVFTTARARRPKEWHLQNKPAAACSHHPCRARHSTHLTFSCVEDVWIGFCLHPTLLFRRSLFQSLFRSSNLIVTNSELATSLSRVVWTNIFDYSTLSYF